MFSKEEYQECLETLLRFAHESPNVKWALIHERIRLENLIETYPEYLELKAKATLKKVVKGGGWNCPNCNMKLLSGHDLAKENINFCFECGQALDWGNDETKPTRIYSEVTIKDGEATFTATDENEVSTKIIITRY